MARKAVSLPRIPFATAIADPQLFKTAWEEFFPEQRAILKMIYGLPLDPLETRLWHALNGGAVTDELGFLLEVTDTGLPAPRVEAEEVTLIIGRRGTKSSMSSFILAYEALCGGHKAYLKNPRQQPVFLQVAQDLPTGRSNLRHFILYYLESSPIGKAELGNIKDTVTADSIRLANCGLITVGPPNIKLRGQAIAICAMDEMGFWAKDKESAAPDYEVEAAVKPGMAQFPYRKLLKMSSPWTKEGLLWTASQKGSFGHRMADPAARSAESRTLVLKAPTAVVNPTLSNTPKARLYLERQRAKDGDAFRREFLAEFSDAVSGFLPVALLHRAVSPGITRREPEQGVPYVATMDPAFRRDAFALCIGHLDTKGHWVQDFIQSWRGQPDQPLSPSVAMKMIGGILSAYGVRSVVSDQYHVESLQELAMAEGFMVEPHVLGWKNKQQMWGEFLTLMNQDRVRLLDHKELLDELRSIEKALQSNGTVKISGKRDDLAMATALCLMRTVQFGVPARTSAEPYREPTAAEWDAFGHDRLIKAMAARRQRDRNPTARWYAS